ncbi:MAG: DegV family protein [Anaerolineales bacterium]
MVSILPNSQPMPNVCILTDSTVQFTRSNFPGHERVYIIPSSLQNVIRPEGEFLSSCISAQKQLIPPSPQKFIQWYARLSHVYDSILVLTLSAQLNPTMLNALGAADQYNRLPGNYRDEEVNLRRWAGEVRPTPHTSPHIQAIPNEPYNNSAPVEVIDSQTTSSGLGMLVQIAASAASEGATLKEIDQRLRANIPRIYMLLCIPELTYLANSGQMNFAQALVGEMTGMLPIFTFEEGRLVPMEKARTPRHLFEVFQEFMSEFEAPSQVALIRSLGRSSMQNNPIRQFVNDTFPEAFFSEHTIQPHLAALFGPHSVGLVVLDSTD